MRNAWHPLWFLLASILLAYVDFAAAQQSSPSSPADSVAAGPSLTKLAKALNNPLTSVWNYTLQNNLYLLDGSPSNEMRGQYVVNLLPTLPLPLTTDWNLITEPAIPFVISPDLTPGGWDRVSGYGDMGLTAILSATSKSEFQWGIGPTFIFPTASSDALGQGKWQFGPAVVGIHIAQKWMAGAFVQQWWGTTGDDTRPNTNQMDLQYWFFWFLPKHWQIGMSPNVLVDWTASDGNKLTFPIGLNVGNTFPIGKTAMQITFEPQVMLIHPDDFGQRWNFRLVFQPATRELVKGPIF